MKAINVLIIIVALFMLVGCAQEADDLDLETDDNNEEDIGLDDMPAPEIGDELDQTGNIDGNTSASPPYNATISVEGLAEHNLETDCWVVFDGSVYDITDFLPQHKTTLAEYCGTSEEFEDAFMGKHNTSKVAVLMEQGVLKGELI